MEKQFRDMFKDRVKKEMEKIFKNEIKKGEGELK